MKISMYNMTVPVFIKSLSNLSLMLEKAEVYAKEKQYDVLNLLHDRLAPDQYDFTRQIQIASDAA